MNLNSLFAGIDDVRIGVIGDFCLDVYWTADMARSELSRETPHHPLPIVAERMQPGGAGNVASNLSALRPAGVEALGVIGADWRGAALTDCLRREGVSADGFVVCPNRVTNAYIKPLRRGVSDVVYEDPRLDFENFSTLPAQAEAKLIAKLASTRLDLLCVCDQMRFGAITPAVRDKICEMGRAGLPVLVDSRERAGLYRDVIIKPNESEAAHAVGRALSLEETARALSAGTRKPVLLTLGARGCLVWENNRPCYVPARRVEPPIDVCGAGDTFLSALACALAAGANLTDAAEFANAAASVSVQKLHTTGTASREEIERAMSAQKGRT